MYVVTSKGGGVVLMIAALILLGTWPALFNLLERRGRKPQHTFMDYCIFNYLVAIIIALTLGQIGYSTEETPNFIPQLHQDNGPSVGFAVAGGILLCLGNIGTQYALAYTNLSITEVVGSSLTVVGGTILNYFLDGRINRAEILFPGVACFLIAAITGLFVHASNMDDHNTKMGRKSSKGWLSKGVGVDLEKAGAKSEGSSARGSAQFLADVESRRSIKVVGNSVLIGVFILCFNGTCYALFSPAFNLATNDQWNRLPEGVPHLVIYTAFFYFSTSFFIFSLIVNTVFLYFPILGAPKSSLPEYFKDMNGRLWAVLAGIICGLGNSFQFMGGQAAGYAAADSVQALPLVSTIWGVVLFGEYFRSSKRTYILLAGMLFMFAVAVGLLMGSAGTRNE
ncbi:putative ureide permease 2 [Coccomyxa subellipsoidea C-169]|uniref:Ureide permease 2 n=1 Tax=Coccomyxa subellipsoidea (strain C-169) TaxID=574566 RepID=I0Z1Y3_COCSC|nr:putative ureide permease 2 [Coccomyxa subellipsoidea C-169]EIE24652.1 putative ureide permease 2 [Coccomyxa subellipsoidea C-169]|eukprot:XP_005649196.1 putative ureide permease 2 [Coccomyxa subellipsoidea C-169]